MPSSFDRTGAENPFRYFSGGYVASRLGTGRGLQAKVTVFAYVSWFPKVASCRIKQPEECWAPGLGMRAIASHPMSILVTIAEESDAGDEELLKAWCRPGIET